VATQSLGRQWNRQKEVHVLIENQLREKAGACGTHPGVREVDDAGRAVHEHDTRGQEARKRAQSPLR
jgi:hypothetical protein